MVARNQQRLLSVVFGLKVKTWRISWSPDADLLVPIRVRSLSVNRKLFGQIQSQRQRLWTSRTRCSNWFRHISLGFFLSGECPRLSWARERHTYARWSQSRFGAKRRIDGVLFWRDLLLEARLSWYPDLGRSAYCQRWRSRHWSFEQAELPFLTFRHLSCPTRISLLGFCLIPP